MFNYVLHLIPKWIAGFGADSACLQARSLQEFAHAESAYLFAQKRFYGENRINWRIFEQDVFMLLQKNAPKPQKIPIKINALG